MKYSLEAPVKPMARPPCFRPQDALRMVQEAEVHRARAREGHGPTWEAHKDSSIPSAPPADQDVLERDEGAAVAKTLAGLTREVAVPDAVLASAANAQKVPL
mmetsp:Transcript_5892/g.10517  ORF Transcript_5892/g.10517 Transcript_5892/m.10517 type:complete len:102 (+) Transcript_5892:446-751(+)